MKAYVFHHIPKCGGTSLLSILDKWFFIIRDYRPRNSRHTSKIDIKNLKNNSCLCSHFEVGGYYLHHRYPGILNSNYFRIIYFIRDPLSLCLSLFRYEKLHFINTKMDIYDHIYSRRNYIANRFPVTIENYKEVLDKYFFIGVLEYAQPSIDLLAEIIGKPRYRLPYKNSTTSHPSVKNSNFKSLSDITINDFYENNKLDYSIYDYCVNKFLDKIRNIKNNAKK